MTYPPPRAKKTKRRLVIIDGVLSSLMNPRIFSVINYKEWDEIKIKTYMHRYLIDGMKLVFSSLYPEQLPETIERKADDAVLWESDTNVTISHIHFFGVQHRPDFEVKAEGVKIAVEIKRGESGQAIRSGIGQSLVYSTHYDFVVYLFIDTSKGDKISETVDQPLESQLVDELWDGFNVKLLVV